MPRRVRGTPRQSRYLASRYPGIADPGDSLWGPQLDAACASEPDISIGQYFAASSAGSGAATTSAATSPTQTAATAEALSPSIVSSPAFMSAWYQMVAVPYVGVSGNTIVFTVGAGVSASQIKAEDGPHCSAVRQVDSAIAGLSFQTSNGRVLFTC